MILTQLETQESLEKPTNKKAMASRKGKILVVVLEMQGSLVKSTKRKGAMASRKGKILEVLLETRESLEKPTNKKASANRKGMILTQLETLESLEKRTKKRKATLEVLSKILKDLEVLTKRKIVTSEIQDIKINRKRSQTF